MVWGVPFEFSRASDEGKEKLDLSSDEQNHSNRSTTSLRPTSPAENVITKAGSPSPHQPGSGPHLLLRSNPRNQEHEGVEGKALRAPEPPTSEKEGKRATTSEGRELRETSVTGPYNLRRKAESTPPSSYTGHNKRDPQTCPDNPIERTNSSSIRKSDSGYGSLPDPRKSREVGRPSDSASPLAKTRSTTTPPTSFTTQSQPKHVTRASSTNDSTICSADHRSRPLNVAGESQTQTAPSISPSISSRVPAPAISQVAHRDSGTPSGPIKLSNSMRPVRKPHTAAETHNSQDVPPSTRTPRETATDGDASSRLSGGDGGDGGQTRVPSGPRLDPTHGTGENNPVAKPDHHRGLNQPSSE
jgi:hypothetical protein